MDSGEANRNLSSVTYLSRNDSGQETDVEDEESTDESFTSRMLSRTLSRDPRPLPEPTIEEIEQSFGSLALFFIQFNISHAGIALGCSAYAAMWRALQGNVRSFTIPAMIPDIFWWFAVLVSVLLYFLLGVRALIFPVLIKRDFINNRLTNFFASPAIVISTLATSSPSYLQVGAARRAVFYGLIVYQLLLSLYWYGDWLFATGYSLRSVHSLYFMATVGFFVVATLGATVGATSTARISFFVGIIFWLLVFIAVFSFLSKTLSDAKERPQPTMCLFIAPPASAALAWIALLRAESADVVVDNVAWFFLSLTLFLYMLVARLFPLYWKLDFNVAFWAFTFPLCTAGTLATTYAGIEQEPVPWVLAGIAAIIATLLLFIIFVLTVRAIIDGSIPKDDIAIKTQYRSLVDYRSGQDTFGLWARMPWFMSHEDRKRRAMYVGAVEDPDALCTASSTQMNSLAILYLATDDRTWIRTPAGMFAV